VAAALAGSAVAAQAQAPRESAAQMLEQARESARRSSDLLRKVKLPMSVEPAAVFRA
jgi:hypothetical protein